MVGDNYDVEEEYLTCKKCKSKCEKVLNEKTNKPYTLCEKCRSKCGSKGEKSKQAEELPDWKIFNIEDNNKNVKPNEQATNSNLENNDIATDSEENDNSVTENIDEHVDKPKIIKGELMVGSVKNIDDIEKNISTLSLNDRS